MSRISDFIQMLQEGRFGFVMDEVMEGEHVFEPGFGPAGRHHMEFKATWGPSKVGPWLNPWGEQFLKNNLTGTVTIGGLCQNVPMAGTLELNYFDEHKIRYAFEFEHAEKGYRYVGEKVNIQLHNLPFSHTTCFGTLVEKDTQKLVSRSTTYFRFRRAPQFVASLRFA